MIRIRWLSLLITWLWASGSLAASFGDLAIVKNVGAVQDGLAEPLTAQYVGKTVIQTTEPLILRLSRDATATSDDLVFTNFLWKLNGQAVGTSSYLEISLPETGDYSVQLSYRDLEGYRYAAMIDVRVMEPAEYNTMMAAVLAAANLPLWLEDEELFLPIVYQSGTR
jgi:hypothetical protein